MRILVINDRRFVPPGRLRRMSVHYTPGLECTVKRAWGEALVRAGDAVEVPAPPRRERTP